MAQSHSTVCDERRRQLLRNGALLTVASAVLLAETAWPRPAAADDKATQKSVQYQTNPKDGKDCASCMFFEAPSNCKVVASPVAPEGWCMRYAPKPAG